MGPMGWFRSSTRGWTVLFAVGVFTLVLTGCGQESENKPQSTREDRVAAAIDAYEKVAQQRPGDAAVRAKLGRALIIAHRYDEGVIALREAVRLQPNLAQAHADLGAAYGFQEEWERAIASFKEAIRLAPEMVDVHSRLGTTYLAVRDLEGALREYKWLETRNPALAQELLQTIETHKTRGAPLLGPRW